MMTGQPDICVREYGHSGERVVLLHGSINIPLTVWAAQRELGDQYHLLMPDRRGHGDSASILTKPDHEVDVDDSLPLLGDGAHLVGFSSGGVIAMLVAARRPDLVRSLTLLEPPAMQAARGNPLVEDYLSRAAPLYASRPQITPAQFIHGFGRMHMPDDAPDGLIQPVPPEYDKSVYATMHEPAPWDVVLPLERLATLDLPTLVVSGDWFPAMEVIADALAAKLRAERAVVRGNGHGVQKAPGFNERIVTFWRSIPQRG